MMVDSPVVCINRENRNSFKGTQSMLVTGLTETKAWGLLEGSGLMASESSTPFMRSLEALLRFLSVLLSD